MNTKLWLNKDAVLKIVESTDAYNKPVILDEKPVKVKIEQKVKLLRGMRDEEIITDCVIYIDKEEEIKVGYFIDNHRIEYANLLEDHIGRPMIWEVFAK